ncbi:hypothetical protein ACOMHN_010677 [Nucella lapillus]
MMAIMKCKQGCFVHYHRAGQTIGLLSSKRKVGSFPCTLLRLCQEKVSRWTIQERRWGGKVLRREQNPELPSVLCGNVVMIPQSLSTDWTLDQPAHIPKPTRTSPSTSPPPSGRLRIL